VFKSSQSYYLGPTPDLVGESALKGTNLRKAEADMLMSPIIATPCALSTCSE
jgi:hypothetical protein